MDWENYENVVKSIYEALGAEAGVKVMCHGRDCKATGKSGTAHQLDVLLEHSDGIHTYKTAVECKYWATRLPKDPVTKLTMIMEDAHIHKGVIVSQVGFTEDAMNVARYKNIELVELRKPTKEDWKGRVKDIHIKFICRTPVTSDFRMDIVDDGAPAAT